MRLRKQKVIYFMPHTHKHKYTQMFTITCRLQPVRACIVYLKRFGKEREREGTSLPFLAEYSFQTQHMHTHTHTNIEQVKKLATHKY